MKRRQLLAGSAALCASTVFGGTLPSNRDIKLYVPPEESPHKRTFMQWPVSRRVYRDRQFQEIIQQTIADIANTISEFEPVVLLAAEEHHRQARRMLSNAVELWDIPTDDLWCRDSGPLFAQDADGKLVISHLQFNGWGEKQTHSNDALITARISKLLDIPLVSSGLVGEAGGVDHDGHGLLMAHESSWVNDNRNPGLSRAEIEKRLLLAYGAQTMIWSPGVWDEDITDYHIDSLARFTSASRVLINLPETPDRDDPFHSAALETYDALLAANLDVDVISEPEYRRVDDIEFVASYANYYACNGGIVAAQFGDDEADERALEALEQHYPGREIVSLNVDALGEVGGGIHCATQQMPA